MSGQSQNIFTIQEAQLSSGNNGSAQQQRASQSDILIDTSSIALTQQAPLPLLQHHQHALQASNMGQQNFDTITSQPMQCSSSGSAKVAPENQSVVYSVHPIFSLLDQHDALLVRQRADCTSTCCGFESVNTYTVRAKDGTPMLKAIESEYCLPSLSCFSFVRSAESSERSINQSKALTSLETAPHGIVPME